MQIKIYTYIIKKEKKYKTEMSTIYKSILQKGHLKFFRCSLFKHPKISINLQILGHITILRNKYDSLDVHLIEI